MLSPSMASLTGPEYKELGPRNWRASATSPGRTGRNATQGFFAVLRHADLVTIFAAVLSLNMPPQTDVMP